MYMMCIEKVTVTLNVPRSHQSMGGTVDTCGLETIVLKQHGLRIESTSQSFSVHYLCRADDSLF